MTRLALSLLLGLAAALPAAQVNYAGARNSGRLDTGGASARDEALANAVVALGDGPAAFLVNPASLAGRGLSVALDQSSALGFSRSVLGGTLGLGDLGSAGLHLGYADLGSVEGVGLDGKTFAVRPYQLNAGLGWGRAMPWGWSAGGGVDLRHQSFGGLGQAQAYGGRAGVLWSRQGFSLGLVQGLESDLGNKVLLHSLKAGASYGIDWLGTQRSQAGVQMDYDYGQGRVLRLGLEHGAFGLLALRGGYEMPLEGAYALNRWSTGLGVRYQAWVLDFSFGSRDLLGNSQHITLTWTP